MRIVLQEAGTEYRTASERRVRTPQDAAEAVGDVKGSDTECMCVLCLDTRNGMRAAEIVTNGLLDTAVVHPREVFRAALTRNAASIVLVHNHPSGDTTPSAEDLRVTKKLIEAGKIVDIRVLDHVIIGRKPDGGVSWLSMREEGIVDFAL